MDIIVQDGLVVECNHASGYTSRGVMVACVVVPVVPRGGVRVHWCFRYKEGEYSPQYTRVCRTLKEVGLLVEEWGTGFLTSIEEVRGAQAVQDMLLAQKLCRADQEIDQPVKDVPLWKMVCKV